MSFIHLHIGPMFSSKTTQLCSDIDRHRIANRRCVIVKFTTDTRYEHLAKNNGLVTHRGNEYANVSVVNSDLLQPLYEQLIQYDVIGIDEVQFFEDAPDVLHRLACAGCIIIAAGLDGDFRAEVFPVIAKLVPLAEYITKHRAVCVCCYGDAATFTQRLSAEKDVVIIGGSEMYRAVCRKCRWNINLAEINN